MYIIHKHGPILGQYIAKILILAQYWSNIMCFPNDQKLLYTANTGPMGLTYRANIGPISLVFVWVLISKQTTIYSHITHGPIKQIQI